MKRDTARRTVAAGVAAGLAGGLLLLGPAGPGFASTSEAATCTVSGGELKWGVKERFRNYISGSIANGEWTTENGATYETPAFGWANGAGQVQPDLEAGAVSFTGDVHFTGHAGAMKLDLQDPAIEFTGPGAAQLVLGMGAVDTEGADVELEPVVAALVDLSKATATGTSYSVADAPVRLTADGAAAFNGEYGDYVAGDDMDALSLSFTVSGCELGLAPVTETPTPSEEPEDVAEDPAPEPQAAPIPWLAIAIGGIALVAVGVTTGMLIAGRKKPSSDDAAAQTSDGAPPRD
ncbi:HtaA domain-containing protein [Leucobacter albus]|uniref:HtaA domain-containing protein n=1 Tax=Leucobacter albus TaxID=272210 RepID=A0ABW3TLV9_9MICO